MIFQELTSKICNLPEKDIRIVALRHLSELQENTERQLNELKKNIHEQNKTFNREIEMIKNNQTEILELKNTTNEMKNIIESIIVD